MSNPIIFSFCLFGSFSLTSKSLELINKLFLNNKKTPRELIIINGLTFVVSGSIFIGCYGLLSLSYFKYLNDVNLKN
jgi:hypothetical protein